MKSNHSNAILPFLEHGFIGFVHVLDFCSLQDVWAGLTMSSGLLTTAPVGLATEAVETTLPGTLAWTAGLAYGDCEALL